MPKEINAKEIAEIVGVSASLVNEIFHAVIEQTIKEGRVEITGFGSFKVDEDLRPVSVGSSEMKTVKDINFRLSKQFKGVLNPDTEITPIEETLVLNVATEAVQNEVLPTGAVNEASSDPELNNVVEDARNRKR